MLKTEIAGQLVTYTSIEELENKLQTLLDGVRHERLILAEQDRALRRRERVIRKFLARSQPKQVSMAAV